MKKFIALFLISSSVFARPHTLIECSPVSGKGFSAKFKYDGFDDKYSSVTVYKNNKKVFSMNGDTKANPCLEVDMSAGTDTAESYSDLIAVFTSHDMDGCPVAPVSARLGIYGAHGSMNLKGNLAISFNRKHFDQRVKCLITEGR